MYLIMSKNISYNWVIIIQIERLVQNKKNVYIYELKNN